MLGNASHEQHYVIAGQVLDALRTNPSGDVKNVKTVSIASMDVVTFMENAAGDSDLTGNNFKNMAGASLDTLYAPFSTTTTHSVLPHFETPDANATITADDLNPYNPGGVFNTGDNFLDRGHNMNMAIHGHPSDIGNTGDVVFEKDYAQRGTINPTGINSIGQKLPMIGVGFGYDIDGNPVPADTGDATAFHPDAFWDPNLWKAGPIDLRWDDSRKVWVGGNTQKIYLCKATNTINTTCFSYEVERDNTLAQYTRNTLGLRAFDGTDSEVIYDPQYVAYNNDAENVGCRVSLDYNGLDAPMYEAYIIRSTQDSAGPSYYNLFSDDCSDCGSILEECSEHTNHNDSAVGKKILIENPLMEQIDVGTLMFTVDTGRKKNINTGSFVNGSGTGAAGYVQTDANGNGSGVITAGGSGYTYGAFAILPSGGMCLDVTLLDDGSSITGITIDPTTNLKPSQYVSLTIIPNNAVVETESLPIHWILNTQKFTTSVVTHVDCEAGQLTKMTRKIATSFQTCEIPNDSNTCAVNSF